MSISLTSDSRGLVIQTPYSSTFVDRLKQIVTDSRERSFDRTMKAWIVDPRHASAIQQLVLQVFGEAVALPQIQRTNSLLENYEVRVEYIGRCKQRQDGQITAMGFDGDGWNVIFPEPVLKAFFEGEELNIRVEGTPQPKAQSLYQALLLSQTAAMAEIKSAYRRMARLVHPDVNKEPDAQEQFLAVQRAYEVLSDPIKRKRYDAGLAFTASLAKTKALDDEWDIFGSFSVQPRLYRSPLRCGLITINGKQMVGRILVERILAWNDITNELGQVMVSSWAAGDDHFEVNWV